jgi:hypothetical protein
MDTNKDFQDTYFEQHIYYWLLNSRYSLTTLIVKLNSKHSKYVQPKNQILRNRGKSAQLKGRLHSSRRGQMLAE